MVRQLRKSPRRSGSSRRADSLAPAKYRWIPSRRTSCVCGLLVAAVAVAFLPALNAGFLHLDDDIYVTNEPHVTSGFTAANWDWAWTGTHASNWHPLTTLSHMLDCQFFDLHAWAHHLENLLLHALAAVLAFFVIKEMTGRFWASATVAAIFAVHPLRVESVAWIAERKDLLCGVFFWLTIAAYARYARRPFSGFRYGTVLLAFAAALLAKPMAVSLPVVLLLLDFWPLERMKASRLSALLLEKLPLAAMSLALCIKTYLVQRDAVQLNETIPFAARTVNALMSYQGYIVKTFWPAGLAAHYPFPAHLASPAAIAGAVALMLIITAVAVSLRRSRPYLLVGWLWYLIMLVPVIGLVQVGRQAMADRYTYLPQIGLLIMIVFSAADLLAPRPQIRPLTSIVVAALLALSIVASWRQTRYWHDDYALLQRTLACNDDDAEMQNNMAAYLVGKRDFAAALDHARRAVELDPDSPSAHANLARCLIEFKDVDGALEHAQRAVTLQPTNVAYRYLLRAAQILKEKRARRRP